MGKILVTGSLAYDFIMHFDDIFAKHILLDKLNILNVSFTANKMSKNFGGTAGNIAYSLTLLQESPIIFSTVGKDFQDYRSKLEEYGLNPSWIHVDNDEWTASAHIITDKEDNQITAFYGGAMLKNDISLKHILDKEEISLGIIAANGRDGMLRYARDFKEYDIPYIYDPGQSLPSCGPKELMELTHGAYMIVMNEYENQLFLEKTDLTQEELLEHVEYVIITKGEKGATIFNGPKVTDVHAVKARDVVDPTGAGDAFRGGILKAVIHHLPVEFGVQMGAVAGCYAVEEEGTQTYHYTLSEFKQRFEETYGKTSCLQNIFS